MIVPWFNRKEKTRLITVDLYRIRNTPFCRLHNRQNLWLPGVWIFLEVLMIASYVNYLAYLILGGLWFFLQIPVVLFLAAKRRSWLNTGDTFKKLPGEAKHSTFKKKQEILGKYYSRLQHDLATEKTFR